MGKPHIHAGSSVKHFGGSPQDYLKIHQFIDQSATTFGDLRHRALTHTQWFLREILPLKFGDTIKNSDSRLVSVVEIGEQHVLEDYGGKFIPAVADFLQEMELTAWMDNARDGAVPPSRKKVKLKKEPKKPATETVRISLPPKLKFPAAKPPKNPLQDEIFRPARGCGGAPGVFD